MKKSFDRVVRISGNYTLTADDEYVGVSTRSTPITITLPLKTTVRPNYSFFIKDESGQAGVFPITINSSGGEEIESGSSYTMNVSGGSIEITNNSQRYLVLSSHTASILIPNAGGTGQSGLSALATAMNLSSTYRGKTITEMLSTVGNESLTPELIIETLLIRDPSGAPRTDTLPTAVSIIAAIPNAVQGSTFEFTVLNPDVTDSVTLAVNTGTTIVGTAVVAAGTSQRFAGIVFDTTEESEAVAIYSL